MARYIDAEELLNKRPFTISGGKPSEYLEGFLDCVDEAKEAINNTPTADVAELKHGTWISKWSDISNSLHEYCSICGALEPHFLATNKEHSNYCPNCGANMDGGELK